MTREQYIEKGKLKKKDNKLDEEGYLLHDFTHVEFKKQNQNKQNKNKFIDIENRPVVTRGEGDWG